MRKKGQSLPISITKILLSFTMGVGAALLFYLFKKPYTQAVQNESNESLTEVVLSAIEQLQERWEEGDREGNFGSSKWSCRSLTQTEQIASGFLKCQPAYLECFAEGSTGVDPIFKVVHQKKKYELSLKKLSSGSYGKWFTKKDLLEESLPRSGYLVHVELKNWGVWPVILEDTCRDKYLPQRFYSYGPRSEKSERVKEMVWDNFGRHIFVDKFLVSKMDWALFNKQPIPKDPALPILNLTIEQQEAFCSAYGSKRLDALIWDAATMTPTDLKRDKPQFITKPWLPWSRDRRDTFFEKALASQDWQPSLEDCKKAYVKECQRFPYRPHEMDNISWIGINHVLGGFVEQMRNSVEKDLIYKSSSKIEHAASESHQLGRRMREATSSGFRCYKEVFE